MLKKMEGKKRRRTTSSKSKISCSVDECIIGRPEGLSWGQILLEKISLCGWHIISQSVSHHTSLSGIYQLRNEITQLLNLSIARQLNSQPGAVSGTYMFSCFKTHVLAL